MKIVTHKSFKEWLEWRQSGIGSSDALAVMEVSPWQTKRELWARKTERMLPQKSMPWMRRGKDMEPIARRQYEQMTGISMPANCVESTFHPIILASLDGMNREAKKVIEIKVPNYRDHQLALNGIIPPKYIWQCAHQLLACDGEVDTVDYVSFDGENIAPPIPYKRQKEIESALLTAEKEFWKSVVMDTPPEKNFRELSFQEKLKALGGKK